MLDIALSTVRSWFAPPPEPTYGLVLSGGGARAAYQAGVLWYIAEAFPAVRFPILTGVSAGAINAAYLANHVGSFEDAVAYLVETWRDLRDEHVFTAESSLTFVRNLLWRPDRGLDDQAIARRPGLVDTAPLREFLREHLGTEDGRLAGIEENLRRGVLRACALVTTNYATGQTVTWVQGSGIDDWERPQRVGLHTELTVEHIMASTSLPLLFPAVQIGEQWYGDGGIRLSAPLSPAIHLGADRLLIVNTRYGRTRPEADEPVTRGYPPAAQIIGILMNAIFLDNLDQDIQMLRRVNDLIEHLPGRRRHGLKHIRSLVIRPSKDLARLASTYEVRLSGVLGLLTRGLGTGETKSPDWLSMLLFDSDYVLRLIDIGYEDGLRHHDALAAFFDLEGAATLPVAPGGDGRALAVEKPGAEEPASTQRLPDE